MSSLNMDDTRYSLKYRTDKFVLDQQLKVFQDEMLLYFIGIIAVIGLLIYGFYQKFKCETSVSEGCPFFTCAIKDNECGNLAFYYDNNGVKKCISK